MPAPADPRAETRLERIRRDFTEPVGCYPGEWPSEHVEGEDARWLLALLDECADALRAIHEERPYQGNYAPVNIAAGPLLRLEERS